MAQNTSGKQLADLLVSRGYEPEMLDSSGKAAASAEDAEIFSFDFVTSNDTNHGTVVVMLGADNELRSIQRRQCWPRHGQRRQNRMV
jgi:hypothetical protein